MNYFIVFFPTFIVYIFSKYSKSYLGLKLAFLFLFIIGSLRFDYGNDYKSYYKIYIDISKGKMYLPEIKQLEVGYIVLNKIFLNLNFSIMISFLSLLSCLTYLYIIKKYTFKKNMWLAVLFYLINPYIYIIQLSSIRQTIAINLFILSIPWLNRKEFLKYFLIIIFASLFHKSVLILLPLYLFFNNKKIPIKYFQVFNLLFLIFIFNSKTVLKVLKIIVERIIPGYLGYLNKFVPVKIGYGFGIILNICIFLILPYLINISSKKVRVFIKILYIQYFFKLIGIVYLMISRIEMYLGIGTVVGVPYLIYKIKNKNIRYIILGLILMFYLHIFFKFFKDPTWIEKFSEYKTILFNSYE